MFPERQEFEKLDYEPQWSLIEYEAIKFYFSKQQEQQNEIIEVKMDSIF